MKLKDPSVPYKVFPKTDERCTSNNYMQLGLFDSLIFKIISVDTIVIPLGEDKLSPQIDFIHTKKFLQIKVIFFPNKLTLKNNPKSSVIIRFESLDRHQKGRIF